ncbi:PLP-dependent aminotransferase family protein [Gimibacter soli]|uniref:PLP-dependent aminotransferase family protein n=1 Tax=Gimibacter soli TaxID=3024400 RepID=A0AAE9XPW6_9PROT|nr:PLP-dependent aminotransferase family protein [Gimibacter soli]WCL54206.1 PLP-dependent aminotransferase family protein [Gimibacter soli]
MASLTDSLLLSLRGDQPGTLQARLHRAIREAILAGRLRPRERLPATRLLAKSLSLGRNTVSLAYEALTSEGYLTARGGSGHYVAADLPDAPLNHDPAPAHPAKTAALPNLPVSSGQPALDLFPRDLFARLTARAWRRAGPALLSCRDVAGLPPLREAVAHYLRVTRDVRTEAGQVVILSGVQQALSLLAHLLMPDRATGVGIEDPGYPGLVETVEALGRPVASITVDRDGAVPPSAPAPALTVLSPSRQYPLGLTMPLARRIAWVQAASEHGFHILEDDYDSEFRYEGKAQPSLQGLDPSGHVLYTGGSSKALFPAARIAWLVLPDRLVDPFLKLRHAFDSFPPLASQLPLVDFIGEGHFARHMRRLRMAHRDRAEAFISAFRAALGDRFRLSGGDAGLHLIAEPATGSFPDDRTLARLALDAGIGAAPLSVTYRAATPRQGLLMGFADIPPGEVEARLARFAAALAAGNL